MSDVRACSSTVVCDEDVCAVCRNRKNITTKVRLLLNYQQVGRVVGLRGGVRGGESGALHFFLICLDQKLCCLSTVECNYEGHNMC